MMCLAILKLPGGIVTRRQLKNSYSANTDGAGMAFVSNGKLCIDKGYFGFRRFYKKFREAERANPNSVFMLHFRTATSGILNKLTCHPFEVNKNLAFVHNGIFTGLGTTSLSDTQVFNMNVLQKLPEDFIDKQEILNKVTSYVEKSFSKLIFLNNKQEYVIIGESYGEWVNSVWFSNSGYKHSLSAIAGYGKYSYENYWGDNSHAEYLSNTFKKCGSCGVYQPIVKLTWRNSDWVCDHCLAYETSSLISEFNSHRCKCRVCKEIYDIDRGVELSNGSFYCDGCWFAIRSVYTIRCPYCSTAGLLEEDDTCSFCGMKIEEDDYVLQLTSQQTEDI